MSQDTHHNTSACRVKWFDPIKGFGFLVPIEGGPDILLHANVLRNAGRNSIANDVELDAVVVQVDGRWQASAISNLRSSESQAPPKLAQFEALDPEVLSSLPYLPARIKWFDLDKGFGFANVFGSSEDVFVHIEVLRAAGLNSLESGEAISVRIINSDRGCMAAQIADWSS